MQRLKFGRSISLLSLLLFGACSSSTSPVNATGGASSSAGAPGSGGVTSSGGATSGGVTQSGGAQSGGSVSTLGGQTASGGGSTTAGTSGGGATAAGGSGGANSGGTAGTAPVAGATSGGSTAQAGNGGSTAQAGSGGNAMAGSTGMGGSAGATSTHWVGTWATGLQITEMNNLPPSPGLAGNTLRQMVHVSIGGSQLRVRLSNEYGKSPVVMESVHVATSKGSGAIDAASDKELAFSGQRSVTIPAGKDVVSDVFQFALPALSDLAITIKFGTQSGDVTGHPGSRTTSYIATGNAVSAATLPSPVTTDHWYFIEGVDVAADPSSAAIVVLGDSITDGRGSTTNGNDRWPDQLARRLQANPATSKIAVLNQGIGGNTVLAGGLGPTALTRFDHDVLQQVGVKWVIVLEGVNDIGNNSTANVADDLIAAYEQFISKAKAKQLKIFGVPILPFAGSNYDSTAHQAARTKVNDWIRNSKKFDAVIDLDAAVRDSANPNALRAAFLTPDMDRLHINPTGYKAMADAVDLTLFQ